MAGAGAGADAGASAVAGATAAVAASAASVAAAAAAAAAASNHSCSSQRLEVPPQKKKGTVSEQESPPFLDVLLSQIVHLPQKNVLHQRLPALPPSRVGQHATVGMATERSVTTRCKDSRSVRDTRPVHRGACPAGRAEERHCFRARKSCLSLDVPLSHLSGRHDLRP